MDSYLPSIILASASPRRKELLQMLGLSFTVVISQVDEKSIDVTKLSPREKVIALACYKGESIACNHPDSLVIAADTIVVTDDNEVLEKPEDSEDAFRMLSKLQDSVHSVFSAVAIFYKGRSLADASQTRVRMRAMSSEEIRCYIGTGEPMDKAGAYAIQGIGSALVEWIEGCYFTVVGMPINLLDRLSRELGIYLVLG